MRTCVSGRCALIWAVADAPSRPGICRSISTTSGCSRSESATASGPLDASPTTSNPGSGSSIPLIPLRTTGWSSAISTRTTSLIIFLPGDRGPSRDSGCHRRSLPRRAFDGERAAQRGDALAHPGQPEPARSGSNRRREVEAAAVVADIEQNRVVQIAQREPHAVRAGVLAHVRQRLLRGTQQSLLRVWQEFVFLASDRALSIDAGLAAEPGGELAQRASQ